MDIIGIVVQLISGIVGGNGVGAAVDKFSLGAAGNTVIGAIGGLAGGQVLGRLMGGATDAAAATADAAGGMDVSALVGQIAGGGIGGGALIAIVGIVKNMMAK